MSVKTLWVVSVVILATTGLACAQDCLELEGQWAGRPKCCTRRTGPSGPCEVQGFQFRTNICLTTYSEVLVATPALTLPSRLSLLM